MGTSFNAGVTKSNKKIDVGDWIETYPTHKHVTVGNLESENIKIEDIANALSNQCRFTGHIKKFYSVAQHSVLCAMHCSRNNRLWGLLHDASEAYLSDIASPTKRHTLLSGYRLLEKRIMLSIANKFCLIGTYNYEHGEWSINEPQEVKDIDAALVRTEAVQLGLRPEKWGWKGKELDIIIKPWPPYIARKRFLSLYKKLTKNNIDKA